MKTVAVLFLALAGCAAHHPCPLPAPAVEVRTVEHVRTVYVHLHGPKHTCPAEPELPTHETPQAMGRYIAQLIAAGDACREALEEQ